MTPTHYTVRLYERKDRQDVLMLLYYSHRQHVHLDWYKAGQWLDYNDGLIALAFDDATLCAVMGLSAPLNHTSWIRILAVANGRDPATFIPLLWGWLQPLMAQQQLQSVTVLVLNQWLATYLPAIGFAYQEDVVTLYRSGTALPDPPRSVVRIRHGYFEDLPDIVRVDHAAFRPPWQMMARDIRYSQRLAAACTVAELNGELVGYQVSTRHHTSGHLARLAVVPHMQGQRVGGALLHDLLTRLIKRRVRSVTVNTQHSNVQSQRLYERYGFQRNGFDLPIWQIDCLPDGAVAEDDVR